MKNRNIFFTLLLSITTYLYACSKDENSASNDQNSIINNPEILIDPSEVCGTGNVSDYCMVVPAEWEATFSSDEIVIVNRNPPLGGGPIISILPIVQGSGNLDADMNSFFFQVFAGWQESNTNGVLSHYREKGKSMQGFQYYMARDEISKNDGNGGVLKTNASLLLVQLSNNKVAIIAQSSPMTSTTVQELSYLLFSLRFKNESVGSNSIFEDNIGPWSLTSLNVGAYMTYYKDGAFTKGGATSFTVGINDTYNQITTTQFSATGNYRLHGNQIEEYYLSNNTTYRSRIRFYNKQIDPNTWEIKKATIELDNGWHFQFPSEWNDEN